MHAAPVILTILAGLVGLEWVVRNILALKVWSGSFHLTEGYKTPPTEDEQQAPLLSIVVAAKDEESNIEGCLRSLLDQDYPNFELIVVNDRSSDRTGDIIKRIAEEDPRVRVLHIAELPDGWCGKNHAMQRGIELAGGEWICMTDADCRHTSPRTMSLAMQYARHHRSDLLSLLPTMEMGSFWEYFLQPISIGVMMIWFPPTRVNNPAKSHAYANGMFMLIRRDAYDAIGAHEAIKGSLIEDMDMARRIKSSGLKLQMAPTRGLISVRMYTSLAEFRRGWVRIFLGSFQSVGRLLGALLVLVGRGLTPTLTTAVGLAAFASGAAPGGWWLTCGVVGAASLLAQLVMTARFYRYAGAPWLLGLLYPFGCSAVSAILIETMFRLRPGAKIVWKDTSYSVNSRE